MFLCSRLQQRKGILLTYSHREKQKGRWQDKRPGIGGNTTIKIGVTVSQQVIVQEVFAKDVHKYL